MLMKSDSYSSSCTTTACSNCGVEERRLLHHVRHRGIFRRLCTSCVLRLHPQFFCPICFQVFIPPPRDDGVITCYKCYSSAHSHCVSVGPAKASSPYVCPLCAIPNNPVFKLTVKEADVGVDEDTDLRSNQWRVMGRDEAKKLLAAAKISAASMNKAAIAASLEAERRAKEAAFTRKRAKEALEYMSFLVVEKLRKNKALAVGPGICGGMGILQSKTEADINSRNTFRNGFAANSGRSPLLVGEDRIDASENVELMDNSNQALPALNGDELIVVDNTDEIEPDDAEPGLPPGDDISVIDAAGATEGLKENDPTVMDGSVMGSTEASAEIMVDEGQNLGTVLRNTVGSDAMVNNRNDSCILSFTDDNNAIDPSSLRKKHTESRGVPPDEMHHKDNDTDRDQL